MVEGQIIRMGGKTSREAIKVIYTGDELNEKRAEFVAISGEIADLEEQKKDFVERINSQLKPLKNEKERLLDITRKGYEISHKDVKLEANDENGTIEFYDMESGEMVGSRPQYPNERVFETLKIK